MDFPVAHWPVHRAAGLFPRLTPAEYKALVADIRVNGLLEPIWRSPDGAIVDGRHRYWACVEAGVVPSSRTFRGDPWLFVVSQNLHRRQPPPVQRAFIAAELVATNHIPSQKQAAGLLGVPRTAVSRAHTVLTCGTPGLRRLTLAGSVKLSTADRVASWAAGEQDEFVRTVTGTGLSTRAASLISQPSHVARKGPEPGSKTYYSNSDVVSRDAASRIVSAIAGFEIGLRDAAAIDPAITAEEAARWAIALHHGTAGLRKLMRLLRERRRDGQV